MAIRVDPVCGREVQEDVAQAQALFSSYLMRRYYFCSAGCKQRFEQDPRRYVIAIDMICGREVDIDDAEELGLYADHNGQRHYFCSQQCRARFEVNPDAPPAPGQHPHHDHAAGEAM